MRFTLRLLLIVALPSVWSLTCYSGNQGGAITNGSFKPRACPEGEEHYCMTEDFDMKGEHTMFKRCSHRSLCELGCSTLGFPGASVTTCCCEGELCNEAAQMKPNGATGSSAVITSVLFGLIIMRIR